MCQEPIRIKNQYTEEYMFVPCQKCNECYIDRACTNIANLSNYMKEYKFGKFVTLTYDNEHIPYVQNGSPCIYRGLSSPDIVERLPEIVPSHETLPITGFPENSPFTAVLYYRDIQLFLKRLRIHYERNFGERADFKYVVLGEYGTKTFRPHYHVLFLSNKEFSRGFINQIVSDWKMCNWNKLEFEEVFKDATNGIASYLSAYMCGYTLQHGILSEKMFKQKFYRSKDICFTADAQIRKNIEEYQKTGGYLSKNCGIDGNPFGRVDKTKLGRVSYIVVSSRFFNTLYPLPKGVNSSPNIHKFRRCMQILQSNTVRRITPEECSQDYKFCLAYKRYLKRINDTDNFDNRLLFVDELIKAHDMRDALNLRLEMLRFEEMPKSEYIINVKCNSYVENLNYRDFRLRSLLGTKFESTCVERPRSHLLDSMFKSKFLKYKKYLLPKHLNSYYGFNL